MRLLVVQSDPFSGPGLMEAQWRLRGLTIEFALPSEPCRRCASASAPGACSTTRSSRCAFGEILAHRFADQM
jgi:hypothetical protein